MTGKRRSPRRRFREIRIEDLTFDDLAVLVGGLTNCLPILDDENPCIIRTEEDIPYVWYAIRFEALAIEGLPPNSHPIWPSSPGTRSMAVWTFEHPHGWDDNEDQDVLLDRIGELRDDEKRWLRHYARRCVATDSVQAGERRLVERWGSQGANA